MSRYIGPRLRIIRRLGLLPCFSLKRSKKLNPPGFQGSVISKKTSEFSLKLKEKQKLRFNYCVTERQLLNYLKKAKKKKGSTGIEFLTFLEMRLDNILFRASFFPTIIASRQAILHGYIFVNDSIINVPSFSCKPSDIILIKSSITFRKKVNENFSYLKSIRLTPSHLSVNIDKFTVKILNFVSRSSVLLVINELLVIEFYSRML